MPYAALADAVVAAHLGFVVWVVFGGLSVLRWPRLAWLHVPAAVWGALVELAGWTCPLTPLENHLRALAGADPYRGGFVEQYLLPLLYPQALTRELQWLLGAGVLLVNGAVYLVLWRRRGLRRRHGFRRRQGEP